MLDMHPRRGARRGSACAGDESGLGMVEVMMAVTIMGVTLVTIAGAMSLGMSLVGSSRQRSGGAAVASQFIERARNHPFSAVAMNVAPTAGENGVSSDGQYYDTYANPEDARNEQNATPERLVVGTAAEPGLVEHQVTTVRGPTTYTARQYVTCPTYAETSDPECNSDRDHKRVTVVLTWARPASGAMENEVIVSTLVGRPELVFTPEPTVTPSTSPTPSPSPTPDPDATPAPLTSTDADCNDADKPSGTMTITSGNVVDGVRYTNSQSVSLRLNVDPDECDEVFAEVSNFSTFPTSATNRVDMSDPTDAGSLSVSWVLTTGDGTKTIYGRFIDASLDGTEPVLTDSVVYDSTSPTTPTSFRATACSISGSERTATFAWAATSDANPSGYELYRSVNSGPFSFVGFTTGLSISDVSKKTDSTVRYLVRAVDKAANRSGDSTIVSYVKNAC